MRMLRLIVKELSMRKTGAMLGGCAVALVTGGLVVVSGELLSFDKREDAVLREKESQTSLVFFHLDKMKQASLATDFVVG